MEVAMESGADDIATSDDNFEITCDPEKYGDLAEAFEQAEIECVSKQVMRIPNNTVDVSLGDARKVLKLVEDLDDHDDVQNVSANFNIDDEAMATIEAE